MRGECFSGVVPAPFPRLLILFADFDLTVSWGIRALVSAAHGATLAAWQVTGAFDFMCMTSLAAVVLGQQGVAMVEPDLALRTRQTSFFAVGPLRLRRRWNDVSALCLVSSCHGHCVCRDWSVQKVRRLFGGRRSWHLAEPRRHLPNPAFPFGVLTNQIPCTAVVDAVIFVHDSCSSFD